MKEAVVNFDPRGAALYANLKPTIPAFIGEGFIVLTNQRLVFIKTDPLIAEDYREMDKLEGALKQKEGSFYIPLEDIQRMTVGGSLFKYLTIEYRKNSETKALAIELGHERIRGLFAMDDWKEAIRKQIDSKCGSKNIRE